MFLRRERRSAWLDIEWAQPVSGYRELLPLVIEHAERRRVRGHQRVRLLVNREIRAEPLIFGFRLQKRFVFRTRRCEVVTVRPTVVLVFLDVLEKKPC
jgi:hypothetical protein